MMNLPKRIFLQIGDLEDLHEVTWSAERIYNTDIEYILKPAKAKKSVVKMAKEANGRSQACAKCSLRMTCTDIDTEICNNAFIEGFMKGYKQAKKGG